MSDPDSVWPRVEALFNRALNYQHADQQERFLRRACAADTALYEEVRALLNASEAVGDGLQRIVDGVASEALGETAAADGRSIGPYRLLHEVGRGGMSTVFLAQRDDHYRQQVAIKLMRGWLFDEEQLQRFRAERQILANLNHPHIARLLDGGTTEDGLPYLVMEYVEGEAIDVYCDRKHLPVAKRLALFRTVCEAVQYAHRNLVVHRDIKPSNIMVNEDGEVKLLDFGIAKLQAESPDMTAVLTSDNARMLTPEYASPEQIKGEPVSTATDVYSLGVVLYRLLTGRGPYLMRGRASHSLFSIICEEEPTRPSTAVTRAAGDADTPSLGQRYASDLYKLRKQLMGDLDKIILMSLRKEPERRYSSVEMFSEDLRRYLDGLPVSAAVDTLRYRASKFVRRHRWGVGFSLLLSAIIVGLSITALLFAMQAEKARHEADNRRLQAEDLIGFMVGDFRAKLTPLGRLDLLDEVGAKALEYFSAVSQDDLSDEELFRRSQALSQIGEVRITQNNLDGAMAPLEESLALAQTLAARNVSKGEWQLGLGISHYWVGYVQWLRGDLSAALAHFQAYRRITEALVKSEPSNQQWRLESGYAQSNIGSVYRARGDLDEALEAFQSALQTKQALLASDPENKKFQYEVAVAHNHVGVTLREVGRLPEALVHLQKDLNILQQLVDGNVDHTGWTYRLAVSYAMVGTALRDIGESENAAAHYENSIRILAKLVKHDTQNTVWRTDLANGQVLLAQLNAERGRYRAALDLLKQPVVSIADMVRASPESTALGRWLALANIVQGKAERALGRGDVALVHAQAAHERLMAIFRANEKDLSTRRGLIEAKILMGDLMWDRADSARATRSWEQAWALLEPMQQTSTDPRFLELAAQALVRMKRKEQAQGIVKRIRSMGYAAVPFTRFCRNEEMN